MQPWEQYSYRVFWSAEDEEYVGVCSELSGLSWLAPTPEAALRGIRRAARDAVEILRTDGDIVPEPLVSRTFSGVFKVRVPPEVHRGLVREASEQGISLNRLITVKLAGGGRSIPTTLPRRRKQAARGVASRGSVPSAAVAGSVDRTPAGAPPQPVRRPSRRPITGNRSS